MEWALFGLACEGLGFALDALAELGTEGLEAEQAAAQTSVCGVNCWWSGPGAQAAANNFANQIGAQTLEMTPLGQYSEAVTNGLDWAEARPIWNDVSYSAAAGASGDQYVFQSAGGVGLQSIQAATEIPALTANPAVTNIYWYTVVGDGSIVPVP